jgi:hypothetical protein
LKYEIVNGEISPVTKEPIQYKKLENGTCYHKETPDNIIEILETLRLNQTRVRFHYGNTETGRDWEDTYGMAGTIGRSTGSIKIPLIITSRRSYGGVGMLDHCIVKIEYTTQPHKVIYQHPKYHIGTEEEIKAERLANR